MYNNLEIILRNFKNVSKRGELPFGMQTIMKTILFQGDSITDADRHYDNIASLGEGYPNLVAASLGKKEPGKYTFINKGISGNRSTHLYARYREDIVALKPDYMSVLIGVNDVWHSVDYKDCFSSERYEELLTMLIEDVTKALPKIKIAIFEPFVLKGTATEKEWEYFGTGVRANAEKAKKVAEKYGLIFIPTQDKLDKFCENTPTSYWLKDGVHPTPAGHEFLKEEWLKAFNL